MKKFIALLIAGIMLIGLCGCGNSTTTNSPTTPDNISKVDLPNDHYGEGMYKVGKDIPAGEYKLVATEAENDGYYAVLSSSYNYGDNIVANDNFSNNAYITVQDGQYLQISRALGEKVD